MNNDNRSNIKNETLLSVLALVIGIIALYLSWQANQITKSNVISRIELNHAEYTWSERFVVTGIPDAIICAHKIRLTNLGGAATSILEARATIYFRDNELDAYSSEGELYFPEYMEDINPLYIVLMTNKDESERPTSYSHLSDENRQPFLPMKIEGFSTVDFAGRFTFHTESPSIYLLYDHDLWSNPGRGERHALSLAYIFVFSSGETVETPRINCAVYD